MALSLVESVEAFILYDNIKELSGSSEDLGTPEYEMIKQNLTELVETANPIRFAYLMTKKDGNIVILADSEDADSVDYSHPGQIYEEASDTFYNIFESGQTVITEPETDRWGTWISALVPVKDAVSGKTIAVFGTDYDASEWYANIWDRMASDFLIVLFIFILSSSLFYVRVQHLRNNELSKKLAYGEMLYSSVFDQAPVGVALSKSTELNRFIPKKAIYDKFKPTTAERKLFDDQINKITIVGEISNKTVNISQGEKVNAIYILLITMKTKECDKKNIALLSKLIDQKMLFALKYENEVQFATYRAGRVLISDIKPLDSSELKLNGLDLDSIWDNLIATIMGINLTKGKVLDESIIENEEKEKLMKQIAVLEKKAMNERQPRRKWELADELNKLKKQLKGE